MENKIVKMNGRHDLGIRELVDMLKRKLQDKSVILVSEIWREAHGLDIALLSFERYYFRNNSYAGLSVMLTESEETQTADVIGFGGGTGLLNVSFWANSETSELAEKLLREHGFESEF